MTAAPFDRLHPTIGHEILGLRDAVRRHAVASYVLLAWGLSWSYWISLAIRGEIVVPGGDVSHFPGLFGPLIAAFVVTTLAEGRAGIRELLARMFRWRVALRWYAAAALPFALFLLAVGFVALSGGRTPTLEDIGRYSGLPELGLPLVATVALAANGFGEEVGWRGFAQERLGRRMSLLPASLLVGLVWAIWHVPSFAIIESYRQMGLAVVPVFVFGLGSGAIVFGWLYARSGSILVVALAHLALNMGSATAAARGLPQAVVTSGIMVWAATIVWSEWRRSRIGDEGAGADPRRSRFAHLRDECLGLLLRSPLGRFVSSGIVLILYRGRRSGRHLSTPVEYVRVGDRLLVLVGRPHEKQWWRNVQADPSVTLVLRGTRVDARAHVEVGAAATADFARYVAARPRAAGVAADPSGIVLVALDVA